MFKNPLRTLNLAVFLQQQRYIVAITLLFYLENGLTFSDFLLFQSVFYFTNLIAEVPAGYIGDIFNRKYVLIFSYLLFVVRIILWIVIPNYCTILLGEILYGLSKAFYRGVSDGYIYDYLREYKTTNWMLSKYGKFNFFMSLGSAVSCLIGAVLYQHFGFIVLLSIELLCNSTAIVLISKLPKLNQIHPKIRFTEHLQNIYKITKQVTANSKLNIYMLYAGILTGFTSIFVWNFQPIMKQFEMPAILFGFVYFINHILRAAGSICSPNVINKFTIHKTGFAVWITYLLCLICMLNIIKFQSVYLCLAGLLFICVAIGFQMTFNIGNLARIHKLVSSKSRATVSSFNSMLASFFSGLFLYAFKSVTTYFNSYTALVCFTFVFIFVFFIANNIRNNQT